VTKYPATIPETRGILLFRNFPTADFPDAGNMENIGAKDSIGLKPNRYRSWWRYNGIYAGVLHVTVRFPSFLKVCCPIAVFF
jgi:hypothetical protein